MTDLSFMDPPIEVAAASPRLEMIITRLRTSGLRPAFANPDLEQGGGVPLLIDIESAPATILSDLARAEASGISRPVILLGKQDAPVKSILHLREDSELTLLPTRLASQRRRLLRETEVELRRQTSLDMGEAAPKLLVDSTPDILYLGDGSPFFLALQSALKATDVRLTAALSLHTAYDYLENKSFSAILIDMSHGTEHAVRLLERSKADPVIGGLPIFACVRDDLKLDGRERAALSNATEILSPETSPKDTAARIAMLAYSRQAAKPIAPEAKLTSKLTDLSTGLFVRPFLEALLDRQMKAAETHEYPITMLTLKLRSSDEDHSARGALPDLAALVKPLLRETDCPARLDATTIAISLPDTPYGGAVKVAERIIQKLGGDSLGMVGTPLPFGGSLGWRAVERRRYHTAVSLIESATSGPFSRIRAA